MKSKFDSNIYVKLEWEAKGYVESDSEMKRQVSTPKTLRILNHSLFLIAFAAWFWHAGKLIFTNVSSHLRLLHRIRLGSLQWLTSSKCDSNPPRRSSTLPWVHTFLSLNQRQIRVASFVHLDKQPNSFLPIPQLDVTSDLSFRSQIRNTSRRKTHVS